MKHITITGSLGSGKSVVASILKDRLGLEVESVGSIIRKMAQSHGFSTNEFNKYIEEHPEVDVELDEYVRLEGLKSEFKIFDSRLAWNFIPQSFKIFLYVKDEIATKRVFNDTKRVNEKYNDEKETLSNITARRKSEIFRYKKQYGLDLENLKNYDLVIDTSYSLPEQIVEQIISNYVNDVKNQIWISPQTLSPTQNIRFHSYDQVKLIQPLFKTESDYLNDPIRVLFHENIFYILDGHKRALNAIIHGIDLVPCEFVDYTVLNGLSVDEYIRDNFKSEYSYDWIDFIKYLKDTEV